jgi:transglutaminase-like putative cysteine protease
MKGYLLLLIVLLGPDLILSGTPGKRIYPVDEIPEELLEDAVAVVRDYQEIFEIESISKATTKVRYVVTILDENADYYGVFNEWYDNFRSLTDIKIVIYDSEGNVLRRVKSNEIKDYWSFSGNSIYEQSRQKIFVPNINSYPYTVSVEYKQLYKGLFVYPVWQVFPGYDISVEKSSFTVIAPIDHRFRYKASGLDIEPVITEGSGQKEYYWEEGGLKAVEREDYSPALIERTSVLYTAPSDFSIDGYSGNMETWENFGKWAYTLIEGRDELTESTRADIRELRAESIDKRDIVRKVYKYMQSKTRYVSIQEGIGGWQPFPALQVDQDGYGDCKALSNYTLALLKEAGIESFYTKVFAGPDASDIMADFVSNQSNHIILCVPLENDTIWLECTSQIFPFGYIGNFTDDRSVLLVTPQGGKLVKSRTYTREENAVVNSAKVVLTGDQNSVVKIKSSYKGMRYDIVSELLRTSNEERNKWVYNNIAIENAAITEFDVFQVPEAEIVPEIKSNLQMRVTNYGSVTGDRWFIPLNLLTRVSPGSIPRRERDRKSDIVYRRSFTEIDSVMFTLPEGYIIESAPQEKRMENGFGTYSVDINIDKNRVLFVRKRTMNKGRFPSTEYNDFRNFFIEMQKTDNCMLVLKKVSG